MKSQRPNIRVRRCRRVYLNFLDSEKCGSSVFSFLSTVPTVATSKKVERMGKQGARCLAIRSLSLSLSSTEISETIEDVPFQPHQQSMTSSLLNSVALR